MKLITIISLLVFLKTSWGALIDQNLIRKYDQNFYQNHKYQPFSKMISFDNGENEVIYIASKHKACQQTQFRIDLALKNLPNLIIIEGLHSSWGENPNNWDSKIQDGISENGCDVYYAYKKAKELKIPFLGIEPGPLRNFSSYERDIEFLNGLNLLIKKHKKIMVVYGAGHFVQQELVLNSIFGKPISIY